MAFHTRDEFAKAKTHTMVIPPKVAPFASSNRSFVRDSRARELETKQQAIFLSAQQQRAVGDISPSAIIEAKTLQDERTTLLMLGSSNERSFVKQSQAKQQQAKVSTSTNSAEKPGSSKTAVYRELLASTDRSFVKRASKHKPKNQNHSFQGHPTTPNGLIAARGETPTVGDISLLSLGSPSWSATAKKKGPPSVSPTESDSATSCATSRRGASYWAEWAANEDVENVVAMLNMTVDPSLNVTTATNASNKAPMSTVKTNITTNHKY